MRVEVEQLPVHGRDVRVSLADPWAVAAAANALDTEPTALDGGLHVERLRGAEARVEGTVSAGGVRTCDRCGADVALIVRADVALSYVPEGARVDPDEALKEADLDVGWYADGVLDLGDVLTEALALVLPTRVTCADADAGVDGDPRAALCDAAVARATLAEGTGSAGASRVSLRDHPALAAWGKKPRGRTS